MCLATGLVLCRMIVRLLWLDCGLQNFDLTRRKKTITKRSVEFETSSGENVSFKARRIPLRRSRVSFQLNQNKVGVFSSIPVRGLTQ